MYGDKRILKLIGVCGCKRAAIDRGVQAGLEGVCDGIKHVLLSLLPLHEAPILVPIHIFCHI